VMPSSMRSNGLAADVVDPFSEVGEARPHVSSVCPIVYVLYRRGRFMGIVSPVVNDCSSCGLDANGDVTGQLDVVMVPLVRRWGGLALRGRNVYSIVVMTFMFSKEVHAGATTWFGALRGCLYS